MKKLKDLKIKYKKQTLSNHQAGMSYIELIVVLAIFSVLTSIVLFDYGSFQEKIEIRNLSSDIASKIVEAQKSSLSGKLPPTAQQTLITFPLTWKPSYGFYVDKATDNKSFIYFADADQNGELDNATCVGVGECLDKIAITQGNFIDTIDVFYLDSSTASLDDITITFKRPNSTAIIKSTTAIASNVDYVEITLTSPKSLSGAIRVYLSGRIQVNSSVTTGP